MNTIELRSTPEVKRIVLAAFPSYRKTKVYLSAFPENGMNVNSYWDGGSKTYYSLLELSSMKVKSLPTSTHPYFEIAACGLANQDSPAISSDHAGNVTLKYLPEGFALLSAGTFCGKPATAHIYLNPANMTKLLAA